MRLEIKQIRDKELHLDYIKMIIGASGVSIRATTQVVVKQDTILVKGPKGRYMANISMSQIEKSLGF